MDSDMGSDSLLGFTRLAVKELFDHKGQWAINQVIRLEGSASLVQNKGDQLGQIYLVAKYLPENMVDDNLQPVYLENLASQLAA